MPPEAPPIPAPWPDPLNRLRAIYGDREVSSPAGEQIYRDREES